MLGLTVPQIIIRGIVVIISLTIHEYAHGLISHVQGDKTPEQYGRLTLNPVAHIDIVGLIALFVFRFGWAKPIPINSYYYKNKRAGIILTSLAGPLSNLLLAFFSAVVFIIMKPQSEPVSFFLVDMLYMNAGLAVFNLIPLPPLDGSSIFAELLGGKFAETIYKIQQRGTIILFLLLWLPPVSMALGTLIDTVVNGIFKLASLIV